MDAAAADARGHAPHQQRRRRHQLRHARAVPPAARVRPRAARGARHRRPAGARGRDDDHARRRRALVDERRPPHLRRGAGSAGHRRHHGRCRGRSVGAHDRDPVGVRALRGQWYRTVVEAPGPAVGSERTVRTRRRPEQRRERCGAGDGTVRRGRGREAGARRDRRVPRADPAGAHPGADRAGQRGARRHHDGRRGRGVPHEVRDRDRGARGLGPHLPPRHRPARSTSSRKRRAPTGCRTSFARCRRTRRRPAV